MVAVKSFGRVDVNLPVPRDMLGYVDFSSSSVRRRPVSRFQSTQNEQKAVPVYDIDLFERIPEEEFAYRFKLSVKEGCSLGLDHVRRIKQELRVSVEEDFRAACGGASGESIQVDFPEFSTKASVIEGRAEVTRIGVTSLTYDARTQKGVIAVRIGSRSFEDARAWVRKNIETIVRDKNIALTTGKVPQDKRFFLGAERVLSGNVLEIEFETE